MNTTRLFSGFIGLLLVSELLSCMDHRLPVVTPGGSQLRVKTITRQLSSGASVSSVSAFSYNNQNRISSILAYQLPDSAAAPVENTVFQYDGQNRLTQAQHSEVRRGASPGFLRSDTYILTYNAAGQVSNVSSPSAVTVGFGYNGVGQPSSFGRNVTPLAGIQFRNSGLFSYTGNNMTSSSETIFLSRDGEPRPLASGTTDITNIYDDKLNPFYGVFIIPAPGEFISSPYGGPYTLYGGFTNRLNFSQNNVLSAQSSDGTTTSTTTYAYTYNAANLPTSRTTTVGGNVVEILRYDYEPY